MPGQRRIDRILADDYLEGLEDRDISEVRRMRDDCEREETGISYIRRVLQGRIDILRAEITRRSEAGDAVATSLLEDLPRILADPGHTSNPVDARAPRHLQPPVMEGGRRFIDRVADETALGSLETRSTEELSEMIDELIDREQAMSRTRQVLFDRIDRLQEEIVRRYREGTADVGDVIAERGA